jgi:hypothetical protein
MNELEVPTSCVQMMTSRLPTLHLNLHFHLKGLCLRSSTPIQLFRVFQRHSCNPKAPLGSTSNFKTLKHSCAAATILSPVTGMTLLTISRTVGPAVHRIPQGLTLECHSLVSILRSTPNHIPLKYRYPDYCYGEYRLVCLTA